MTVAMTARAVTRVKRAIHLTDIISGLFQALMRTLNSATIPKMASKRPTMKGTMYQTTTNEKAMQSTGIMRKGQLMSISTIPTIQIALPLRICSHLRMGLVVNEPLGLAMTLGMQWYRMES
jgi:hypothetical protein